MVSDLKNVKFYAFPLWEHKLISCLDIICICNFFHVSNRLQPKNYLRNMSCCLLVQVNPLNPNDPYRGRTAPLTSKRCGLYIYSTNIRTEYFKHVIYFPFVPLQNAVCFIILTFGSSIIHILYTGCAKIKKKINSGAKRLTLWRLTTLIGVVPHR